MHVLSIALSLLFGTGFIQTVAGGPWQLECSTQCSACWKTGSPGVDIKIACKTDTNCFYPCPGGYENIHCADWDRCNCKPPSCGSFGPCLCGFTTDQDGWQSCKIPKEGENCST